MVHLLFILAIIACPKVAVDDLTAKQAQCLTTEGKARSLADELQRALVQIKSAADRGESCLNLLLSESTKDKLKTRGFTVESVDQTYYSQVCWEEVP